MLMIVSEQPTVQAEMIREKECVPNPGLSLLKFLLDLFLIL